MNESSATRRLPVTVVLLGLTSFFTDVGSEMIYPMLPLFVASLGATPVFLGLVEGIADATASLLKLVSGIVSDRVATRRPMVLFGYAVASLARPLIGLATAPWQVLAIRVTDRVGKGVRTSPRDALIAATTPQESVGRAFGFHRAMDHAGAVLGPLVATALLTLGWELRQVFLATLIPGVLSVVCVMWVREPRAGTRIPSQRAPRSTLALTPSIKGYFAILTVFCLGNSSDVFLLLRAREVGVPDAAVPLLWAAFHVMKLVSSYLGGSWSDRVDRTWVIGAGWLVYALAYLGFGFANAPWQIWALFVVYGVFHGLTEPAEKALVRDLAPEEIWGRAFGIYNFLIGITAVPAGLLTGWLWQQFSPLVALTTGAALALTSALALLLWRERTTKPA
jgi:MFS family permease